MNITIVGAGNVGSALGAKISRDHPVTYVVRDLSKYSDLAGDNSFVSTAIPPDSDIIIIAIPGRITDDFIATNQQDLRKAILVDATNNLHQINHGASYLAEKYPTLTIVKAFNTIGSNIMKDPMFNDTRADGFIAGKAGPAKLVADVVQSAGLQPVIVGGIEKADELEALARLWIGLARGGMGREFIFKIVRR